MGIFGKKAPDKEEETVGEARKKEVADIMQKYKQKLDREFKVSLTEDEGIKQVTTKEYLDFKEEYMPSHMSLYEKACNISENLLKVVDTINLEEPKTRQFVKALGALGMEQTLVVVGNVNMNVALASRNHAKSKVLNVRGLNVYDILKYKGLIMDLEAIEFIEERLKQ